jgi:hypothetical protein
MIDIIAPFHEKESRHLFIRTKPYLAKQKVDYFANFDSIQGKERRR